MKPTTFSSSRILLAIMVIALTVGLVSWDTRQQRGFDQATNDTVPKKSTDRDKKIRDLDDVLDELNSVDIQEALEKARKEVAEAMKNFDAGKIKLDLELAMKEVDLAKIQKELTESMSKMDMNKLREELSSAMKEVDMSKIQKEISESISKVEWDKLSTEMEKMRAEMKELAPKMEKEMEKLKNLGPEIEKEMAKAKIEIEKAKVEIKEYKEFVDGLEKDGLIDKKKEYTIEYEDGKLIINGKKASEETKLKYRPFLEKRKDFKIQKSADDFNIDLD